MFDIQVANETSSGKKKRKGKTLVELLSILKDLRLDLNKRNKASSDMQQSCTQKVPLCKHIGRN